ncbi:S-adenosyl-L-methionine-dependent methyltransferase [Mycena galopus ATCC 62051]|nr:S-adenosyl-L-methionine-dependent methyltransferase [Mycena galopus ATCC 62051]
MTPEDITKMEEITSVPAMAMLSQSELLPTPPKNAKILNSACGRGIVAAVLLNTLGNLASDVRVVCGDRDEEMVKSAAERIKTNGWNAEATNADPQSLPFPDNHFSHNVMNFGIQSIPDPASAMKESFRVLESGGKLGLTYWISPGWLDSFKISIKGFPLSPAFTDGPDAMKESIVTLLTTTGFIHVDIQPNKLEYTDDMSRYLTYTKDIFKAFLEGEAGEKYEAYMRERYGDEDFKLTWEALVITAEKP